MSRPKVKCYDLRSTHALRVEGDGLCNASAVRLVISIHALRVEGDQTTQLSHHRPNIFLSTPSGWRATPENNVSSGANKFLSTPSGWRATKCTVSVFYRASGFLSTPSGWRATGLVIDRRENYGFLSTPSGWRATVAWGAHDGNGYDFYPRPPGGGRRGGRGNAPAGQADFYPRPPGGGRRCFHNVKHQIVLFLSTPSGWRATSSKNIY